MRKRIDCLAVRACTVFILLMFASHAFSQKSVSGKVTDKQTNQPIQGASVLVKGTNIGVQTNSEGVFTISTPDLNSTLAISVVGYTPEEMQLNGQTSINFSLTPTVSTLNEIVVTGYTAQKKKDLTGAVTVVNVEDMNRQPTAQVNNQLQGQASGVTIIGSGQPGKEPQVRIRGINTFGNNTPLYVIDGVPTQNVSDINPNDISSLQVLKDAGAASIYGSRASNGVIIITTKKGKSGKASVSYDAYVGTQQPQKGNVWHVLSPQEMAQLKFNALANSGTPVTDSTPDALYGGGAVPRLPDYLYPTGAMEGDPRVDPSLYNVDPNYTNSAALGGFYHIVKTNKDGTDWFHEIFNPAGITSHNLSVSGGTDKGRYLMSMNYFNQQGTLINTFLKRYTLRANTQFTIGNHIRVGENLEYSITRNPQIGDLAEGSAIGMSFREQPIIPVYDIKGNYAGTYGGQVGNANNPLAIQRRSANNKALSNRLFGNVYADVDFLKNFTIHTSFGGESYAGNSASLSYPQYENQENSPTTNSYTASSYYGYNWTWTNTLSYHNTFAGNHNLQLLVGTEAYESQYNSLGGTTFGYFNFVPDFTTLSSGSGTVSNNSGRSAEGLWSQFGRLDYNYKSKYLLSATIRRDGSSKFLNDQYGWFPAGSVAWRISQENFMKSISWLTDLKIRAGYGIMGNQFNLSTVNGYYTYVGNKNSSFYDIAGTNNSIQQGFQVGQIANPDAKWEKDINTNIGIDASFFKGALELTADYYRKDIKDLLFNPTLPGTFGTGTVPFVNIAQVKNHGLDLSLASHTDISRNLKFDATLTFTTYQNEVTKVTDNTDYFFSGGQRRFGTNFIRNEVGHPIGSFYGYQVVGFWNDAAEIADADAAAQKATGSSTAKYQTAEGIGRFRFKDVNGDGQITDADRTFVGNPNPKFTYGLNLGLTYKSFDFSMFLYGSQGNDIWNNVRYWTDFYPSFAGAKSQTALYDSWTPDNHNAKAPIQEIKGYASTNSSPSSYFVENGSYLRAKNAMLGYTFSKSILQRVGIESFRIYVQAANLFTITKYSGIDPEISGNGVTEFGVDEGVYPNERQYLIGVNVRF